MGNIASSSSSSIKVINVNGTVVELRQSVKVSDIVGENHGQFVCDSSNLRVGCRVPGMAVGDELVAGRLYFILGIDMLYSVLTEEEMESLRLMALRKKKAKQRRIFPVLSDFCLIPSEAKKVDVDAAESEKGGGGEVLRLRSWRPALDTIEEGT